MRKTLDELLGDPIKYVYKELEVGQNGNRVLDVRWFNVIIRVTVTGAGLIIHESYFKFEDLYVEETGWWNEA